MKDRGPDRKKIVVTGQGPKGCQHHKQKEGQINSPNPHRATVIQNQLFVFPNVGLKFLQVTTKFPNKEESHWHNKKGQQNSTQIFRRIIFIPPYFKQQAVNRGKCQQDQEVKKNSGFFLKKLADLSTSFGLLVLSIVCVFSARFAASILVTPM